MTVRVYGQRVRDQVTRDTLCYIYKLDNEQLEYIYKSKKLKDTTWFFSQKIDSFKYNKFDQGKLPDGCYLKTEVVKHKLSMRLIINLPFEVKNKTIKGQHLLYLINKRTKSEITDATVSLSKRNCTYDSGFGAYVLDILKKGKTDRNKYVHIQYQGNDYYYYLNGVKNYIPKPRDPKFRGGSTQLSPGYFIISQPKYRPLDTLKYKAYLVDPFKGKPIRKKVWLTFKDQRKTYWRKKIKRKSLGAYHGQFVLPDSLKIDKGYRLRMSYSKKGRNLFTEKAFRLEDYKLDKNKYELIIPKDTFHAGESLAFYGKATDANGFNLSDTRIKVKLSVEQVVKTYQDTIIFRNNEQQNWYELDTIMNELEATKIIIPKRKLLNGLIKYKVVVEMQDVRQEKKSFVRYIYWEAKKEQTLFYQKQDTIVARQTYKLKDTNKVFDLFIYQNNVLLDSIRIQTPFKKQIAQHYTLAELREPMTDQRYVVSIKKNLLDLIKFNTKRSHDSVNIQVAYPLNTPLHYKIYKEKEEVASGASNKINFRVRDESDADYYLLISSNINGQLASNYNYFKISQDTKKLRVTTDFPDEIYPGSEHVIKIDVRDYKGRAKENINIATYAVSSMFKEALQKPSIHIPMKRALQLKKISLEKPEVEYRIKGLNLSQSFRLKDWMVTTFNLHKNDYYKIYHSLQDIYTHYLPLEDKKKANKTTRRNNSELAVLPVLRNEILKPSYVRLNDVLIYHNNIDANLPYSAAVNPGSYTVEFRFQDKLFRVKNVVIKPKHKTLLCIRLDSILERKDSPFIIRDSLPSYSMTSKELKELDKNSLFIYGLRFDTLKVYPLNNENNVQYYFGRNELGRIQVRDENFSVVGLPPHTNEEVTFVLDFGRNKKIIRNGKSQVCYLYSNKQEYKDYDSMATPLFGSGRSRLRYYALLDVSNKLIPVTVKTEEKKVATPTYKNNTNTPSRKLYQSPVGAFAPKHINGHSAYFSITTSDTVKLAALWLINKNNPNQSAFYRGSHATRHAQNFSGGADVYDIYFLFTNKQYTIFENQVLQKTERWYINTEYFNTLPIEENTFTEPVLLFNHLTKTPMSAFVSYPDERDVQVKVLKEGVRNTAMIQGILQNSYGSILSGQDIFLEKNGRFYRGATSNPKGEFEFLNIPKGDYMLKVFTNAFRPRYAYNISIRENAVYTYTIALKQKNTFVPDLLINENEVQLQVFQTKEKRNLKSFGNLYDLNTRAPIEDGSIQYVRKDGKVLAQYTSNRRGQFDIYSEDFVDSAFHIIFEKKGYRTLKIKNVEFYKANANQLNVFLSTRSNSKNLPMVIDLQLNERTTVTRDRPNKRSPYSNIINTKTTYKKSGKSSIRGKVVNDRGQAVPFANISIFQANTLKGQTRTNVDGRYQINNIQAGTYTLKVSSLGYSKLEIRNISIRNKRITLRNIVLRNGSKNLRAVTITARPKLIDASNSSVKKVYTTPMQRISNKDVLENVQVIAGVDGSVSSSNYFSIAGGRSDETFYTIDGKSVQTKVPSYREKIKGKKGYNLFKAAKAKSLRTQFSNLGFWVPNLTTNKEGYAYATITFPDDVTKWETYVLAMGRNYFNDVYTKSIRSYKPIMVNSIIPRYLYLSDQLEAKAKYVNLDSASHNVQIKVSLNNQEKINKTLQLKRSYVDSVVLDAKTPDSLLWRAELDMDTYYKDGEQIKIPVFKDGLETKDYELAVLKNDTTRQFNLGDRTKTTIYFNNTVLENILVELEKLKSYPYSCNEQKASKVKGLLIEERIRTSLKQPFKNKRMLRSLIKRLQRTQKANGSWAWWTNGRSNNRMTIYIAEVLQEANQKGYNNSAALLAKEYIKKNINQFNTSDKLYALYLLKKMNVRINYEKLTRDISYYDLNTCDRLYYLSNEHKYKNRLSKSRVYDCLAQISAQTRGRYSENFFYDPSANMALASKLLKGTSLENNVTKSMAPLIGSGKFISGANTFAKVYLIDAWLQSLKEKNTSVNAKLIINDTLIITKFPYVHTLTDSKIKIGHTGTDVWTSFVRDVYLPDPKKRDSLFDVRTQFMQGNRTIKRFTKGNDVTMQVKIMSFRTAKNIMIEVPIPSACSYKGKSIPRGNISHIEYYKHKAIYYIERLNVGETTINIPLRLNFSGSYSLPPVNVSLMYYPFKSGNNAKSRIQVN